MISARHDRFPGVLANVLDGLATTRWSTCAFVKLLPNDEPHAGDVRTGSQLVNSTPMLTQRGLVAFLARAPTALDLVNRERHRLGMRPLRT